MRFLWTGSYGVPCDFENANKRCFCTPLPQSYYPGSPPHKERFLSEFELIWEFPKIRGTLFGGPYIRDPTI